MAEPPGGGRDDGGAMERYEDCKSACEACVLACGRTLGTLDLASRRLALECTQACELALLAMDRDGLIAGASCSVCAGMCDALGAECLLSGNPAHAPCAVACARAAQECRKVLDALAVRGGEAVAA